MTLIKMVQKAVYQGPDPGPDNRIFEIIIQEQANDEHRTNQDDKRIIRRVPSLVRASEYSEVVKALERVSSAKSISSYLYFIFRCPDNQETRVEVVLNSNLPFHNMSPSHGKNPQKLR